MFAVPGLWAMKLLGLLPTTPNYLPMPSIPCFVGAERLSARCREFISPLVESFQTLGFEALGFEIIVGSEDANFIDGGACHLFHPNRNFNAVAGYHNFFELHGMPGEFTTLTVWTRFENGHSLGLVNHPLSNYYHDRVLNRKSYQCEASSPFQMLPVFEKLFEESSEQNGSPVALDSIEKLRRLFEKQSKKILETGLASGRFVPMSELEIINMRQARIDKLSAMREQFRGSTVSL